MATVEMANEATTSSARWAAAWAPEEIEGLAEPMGKDGVHTFYTLEGAVAMRSALERMTSGRLVIDVCDMPIKCPVAPIEFAFLADYYFTQKGVRDAIDITLVTPYSGAFTKPNANRVLTAMAQQKGVNVVADFAAESVDAAAKTLRSFDGRTLEYDLLCAIPPNVCPQVIDDSGLGDGTGYALTDPRTLRSRKAEGVYFLGEWRGRRGRIQQAWIDALVRGRRPLCFVCGPEAFVVRMMGMLRAAGVPARNIRREEDG